MNKLIGLTGGMGVGKSTALSIIAKANSKVELVKFAQPLYDMQEFIYSRIGSVIKRDESFTKDRKLLQWLGTDWGRDSISKTLWVDIWRSQVQNLFDFGCPVVCDDVRFDNEAETVRSMGGIVIEITSKHAAARINTQAGIAKHASESGLSRNLIDFSIENDDTLQAFQEKLLAAL